MRTRGPIVAMLLAPLVLVGLAAQPGAFAFAVRGSVVGTGGTPSSGSASAGRVIYATAGQAVVGTCAGASHMARHGFWSAGGSRVIAAPDPHADSSPPPRLALGPPAPNPTAGPVEMLLELPTPAPVHLAVHDLQGRTVAVLVERTLAAGRHVVRWEPARVAHAGIYFARLRVADRIVARHRIVVSR